MPCMTSVYKEKKGIVQWLAARKKSASRPVDKPRIFSSLTALQPMILSNMPDMFSKHALYQKG